MPDPTLGSRHPGRATAELEQLVVNTELGLVVRGGDVPRRIANHFEALITDGVLRPLA